MTATGPAVRVRGLRKIYRPARYREVAALNGLDLDIGRGEIVALLGPNGAGKTTAVQILTGYRRRDAGELTVREVVRHLAGYSPDPRRPAAGNSARPRWCSGPGWPQAWSCA